jgi:hypothetical protein
MREMNKKVNIHVFCYKPDICRLIQKTLETAIYEITCTDTEKINLQFLDTFDKLFDCIIIDRGIEENMKDKIKMKYAGLPMICLPSLYGDMPMDNHVKYIHEPLRLSELVKALDEIFFEKKS